MPEPSIASSLFGLPVSTALDEVERIIVRAFLRNSARTKPRAYFTVYAELARKLQIPVADVRQIERAMVYRIGISQSDKPQSDDGGYGHGVVLSERAKIEARS